MVTICFYYGTGKWEGPLDLFDMPDIPEEYEDMKPFMTNYKVNLVQASNVAQMCIRDRWKHALINALLPVLTVMGTSFGSILGGAVICETVFAIPGLGNYILTAIRSKDIPVVMSSTVFLSAFFCLVMVVVDILYAVIDPRIRCV